MRNFHTISAILGLLVSCVQTRSQTTGHSIRDTVLTIREARVLATGGTPRKAGTAIIPEAMLKCAPALLGEPDILKAAQLLPGVQAGTEGLSGLIVRGGGTDENLILLDWVPVFSSGHILGLFSPFPSEAVKEAVIHKGGIPARFGGRASSVFEIKTGTDAQDSLSGCLGAGLISDKLHLEGPALNGKASFSISARGTHTLLMDGALRALKVPGNFHFHDLHAKVSSQINSNNRLSVSYFSGKDNLYFKEVGNKTTVSWGNRSGSLMWNRRWSGSVSSNTTLALTSYSMNMTYKDLSLGRESYKTGLKDLFARVEFIVDGIPGHSLRTGTEAIGHTFIPEADYGADGKPSRTVIKGGEFSTYIEDTFPFARRLTLETGFRLTTFFSGGTAYISPEPRVSLTAGSAKGLEFKAAYSRISQYIHQLSSPYIALPVDLIVPVTGKVKPVITDQICAGLYLYKPGGWEFSLEGYWKSQHNALEYKGGVIIIDDFRTWEEEVVPCLGKSRGLEVLISKKEGDTTLWIGYTLSRSERKDPTGSISQGKWFPSRHDCRHSVSIVLNRNLGGGWDASAVWTYSSGGAFTIPDSDGNEAQRGNIRLPESHKLNIGVNHRKDRPRGQSIWNLGIYNAYNRKNPNLVFLESSEDGPGSLKTVCFLPIIPSAGYTRVF